MTRWLNGLAVYLLVTYATAVGAETAPPNVLFIAVDDLNHWVGHLGRNPQTRTPNIDRLAARGVTFTRAYCAAPVCNPSRAALLSGLRPSTSGVYDNPTNFAPLIPAKLTLPTAFRSAGYHVCGAGKIYHGAAARPAEWDDYLKRGGGGGKAGAKAKPVMAGKLDVTPLDRDDRTTPDYRTVTYAIEQLRKKHDRPFFL